MDYRQYANRKLGEISNAKNLTNYQIIGLTIKILKDEILLIRKICKTYGRLTNSTLNEIELRERSIEYIRRDNVQNNL